LPHIKLSIMLFWLYSQTMQKERVVSGLRPTGVLHLGSYFGAMRNYIKMQDEFDCYFFVADWHALTTLSNSSTLQSSVHKVLAENIACGLDPLKVALYVQSHVPEIAELYLFFNMLSYKGELEKTATFKDKVRLQPENINAGLLTYPVLQTADIVIQRATKVPVGKDQEQHLEMARNFVQRFNHRYNATLPEPFAFNYGNDLVKILSLDGNGKMSKSENHMTTIYLADEEQDIIKKIMKSKTDAGPETENSFKPDYIENLFTLLNLVSTTDVVAKFEDDYKASTKGNCIIRYGDLKKQLAEDMAKFIAPIREKAKDIEANKKYLKEVMEMGAQKAIVGAKETIAYVREVVGVKYF
jgi:tryptophanyl-tRNA synthetase